ncbi:tudor and KH domain-containing protein [Pelobates fuscus]|uniref:tudor and KH domain-containing protein n=1 Tax=Pelobates fuscus TaxID=191477 RepID=UPI002FE46726
MSATTWNYFTTRQKVVLTIGLSASAAVLYVYYIKYRNRKVPKTPCPSEGKDLECHMNISPDVLKLIVGREGNIRKMLQKQTDAHITVSHEPDYKGEYEMTITGSCTQVHQAQEAVHRIMQECAALRLELLLPARCLCRIIGQGGDKIRSISRSSGAKIWCEPKLEDSDLIQTRKITITGTKEQVEAAKLLIQKILEDAESIQKTAAKSSAFRCHRKEIIAVKKKDGQKHTEDQIVEPDEQRAIEGKLDNETRKDGSYDESPCSSEVTDTTYSVSKFEVPSPDFNFRVDEYVDLYVSATENPQHFWIQILGSRSSQLDKLTSEMSEHYQNQQRSIAEIQLGDIVAATFYNDKFWYRAEVQGFLDNGNVDLYYVDYGDSWTTSVENLFPLRSDFLSLPFQAIECSLTGITPVDGKWTEMSLDVFDELTHCAKWKPLCAKICSFPSPGVSRCFHIQLYDTSTEPILDIGPELIKQGFAIEQKESSLQGDEEEEENLVSRLLDEVTSLSIDPQSFSFSSRLDEQRLSSEVLISSGSEDDVILLEDHA